MSGLFLFSLVLLTAFDLCVNEATSCLVHVRLGQYQGPAGQDHSRVVVPGPMERARIRPGWNVGMRLRGGGDAGWKSSFEAACQVPDGVEGEVCEEVQLPMKGGESGWGAIAGGNEGDVEMNDGTGEGSKGQARGDKGIKGIKGKGDGKASTRGKEQGAREGAKGGAGEAGMDDDGGSKDARSKMDHQVSRARNSRDSAAGAVSQGGVKKKKSTQVTLVAADDMFGRSRRDSFEKRELEGLKDTMSFAEWKK